jgi:Family of unknown function (DUF6335)
MKRKANRRATPRKPRRGLPPETALVREAERSGMAGNPSLSGGDVDADWRDAENTGEETVGGTVSTPDQDVVDEIGRAVGVEQGPADELRTSEEILRGRDQRRWQLEWEGRRSRDRSD